MPNKAQDFTGRTIGRLTVLACASGHGTSASLWMCRCSCGNAKEVSYGALYSGLTKSCGCLRNERVRAAATTHGSCGTREYSSYYAMKARCLNPNNKEYRRYGGRGITICSRWLDGDGTKSGIECFLSDMGPCPKGYTLDRKNVELGYEPSNCRWASHFTQARNRRNTAKDGDATIIELAERHGIKYHTLMWRWRRGERGENLIRPTGSVSRRI
jgi:hypothetical protein